jgi:hypothetical protein
METQRHSSWQVDLPARLSIERLPPEFIEPPTIASMTEEQQTELLDAIRDRRMVAVTAWLAMQEERKRVHQETLGRKFDTQVKRIESAVQKIDEQLEKLQGYFARLNVLRMEATDE